MKKQFVTLGLLLLLLLLTACSGSQDQQQQTIQVTQAPTTQPTEIPTQQATTTQEAPIPSAAELSQLFSAKDGKVTDVTDNGGGKIALDIQVYNPTQTKVKHINYLLMQFFFGARHDVTLLNFAFHADGYTGGDDPIANCGGAASEYNLGYDENQLWDAMYGAFNANLPT
jgi:hypothetical protein